VADVKTELWTYGGSFPHFTVFQSDDLQPSVLGGTTDAALNGEWPSELAALDALIGGLEESRRLLSAEIAFHKSARRKLKHAP
jgi:hypothetical protein